MAKTYLQEKLTETQLQAVNSGITPTKLAQLENGKQDKLTAGTGINITDNVISATGTIDAYTKAESDNKFATKTYLQAEISRAENRENELEAYCDNLDATKAAQTDLEAEVNRATTEENKKINLLGNEAGSGQPYNIPYHIADLRYDSTDSKIKANLMTITVDNKKTLKQFPLEVQIPAGGGSYTAGTNIEIDKDNKISAKDVVTTNTAQNITANKTWVDSGLAAKSQNGNSYSSVSPAGFIKLYSNEDDYGLATITSRGIITDNKGTELFFPKNTEGIFALTKDILAKVKSGTGVPTTSTSGTTGQLYQDTTNGEVYVCKGKLGVEYAWSKLPDASKTVTTDTSQSIKATKTFRDDSDANRTLSVNNTGITASDNRDAATKGTTYYGTNKILSTKYVEGTPKSLEYEMPDVSGVLATTTDILKSVNKGEGAPTSTTEGTKGQLYQDTTNGALYICKDATGGAYTWAPVGNDYVITGNGRPDASTVGWKGQLYTDKSNGDLYICVSPVAGSYEWRQMPKAIFDSSGYNLTVGWLNNNHMTYTTANDNITNFILWYKNSGNPHTAFSVGSNTTDSVLYKQAQSGTNYSYGPKLTLGKLGNVELQATDSSGQNAKVLSLTGGTSGAATWDGKNILNADNIINDLTSTSTSDALSAAQGKVLNDKLSDGSVTKVGTTTKGSATQPIYLNAGTPTAGTTYAGGTNVTLNGTGKSGSTASFYAPTAAGTSGQYLKSSGGTPSWETFSLGTWANVAWSGSDGVVITPKTGYTFSVASGHHCEYRTDSLGRIEVSLRMLITTSNSIPANSYAQIGSINKKNGSVDVWAGASLKSGSSTYNIPFHIGDSGAIYLSNTTSSAISLSGATLMVTFFTS